MRMLSNFPIAGSKLPLFFWMFQFVIPQIDDFRKKITTTNLNVSGIL
jgi:hypothetical protein